MNEDTEQRSGNGNMKSPAGRKGTEQKMKISVLTDRHEIETVKGRPFNIRMSDNDCRQLARIAAAQGMPPADLLAAFVGDLIGGTYSNGSDERYKAAEWLERTCFDLSAEKTFTNYLATRFEVDQAAEIMSMVETMREEMQEETEEEAAETLEIIEREEEPLRAAYADYKNETERPQTEEEALQSLREYTRELDRLLGRNQDAPAMTAQEALNLLKQYEDTSEAIMQAYRMGYAAGRQ